MASLDEVLGSGLRKEVERAAVADRAGTTLPCPNRCGPLRSERLRRGHEWIWLDRCPRCEGVWFDKGEVQSVRRLHRQRVRRTEEEARERRDPLRRARRDVAMADLSTRDPVDEPGGWWFAFLTGLPIESHNRLFRFPVQTWALIAICCLVYASTASSVWDAAMRYGTIPQLFLTEGDSPTRLFASMFLHGGALHLLGNVYFLKVFGDNVEDRLGRKLYLPFYLLCGIAADLLHILMNPTSSVPAIGASGAISGLLGAYLVFFPWVRISWGPNLFTLYRLVRVPSFFYLGFWFLWQLVATTTTGSNVAWWAHIGGFCAGAALALAGRNRLPDARIASRKRALPPSPRNLYRHPP